MEKISVERGARRIFPRERIFEGRSHPYGRTGGSIARRIGAPDECGTRGARTFSRISFERIHRSEPRGVSCARGLARHARLSRLAVEPGVPCARVATTRRSGALLARPAFLQAGATRRSRRLASGLFVLDADDTTGSPDLLDRAG